MNPLKILIINGPNLNMLGQRDKSQYGDLTLSKIEENITHAFPENEYVFYQNNLEGEIVLKIQEASQLYDGIIINPGGYSHTSIAIRDALEICSIPKIEVHLSNLAAREDFRHIMITAPKCDGYISGFKEKGYLSAVYLLQMIASPKH